MSRKQPSKPSPAEVSGIAAAAMSGAIQGSQVQGADAAVEHAYWQQHFRDLPSVPPGASYDQYAPAFEYGWESRGGCCAKLPVDGQTFAAAEKDLRAHW